MHVYPTATDPTLSAAWYGKRKIHNGHLILTSVWRASTYLPDQKFPNLNIYMINIIDYITENTAITSGHAQKPKI